MWEVLRFCVVVFLAGVGYEVATALPDDVDVQLGPFDVVAVGVILGAALGYVLGGVVVRITGRSLAEAERSLVGRSPEQVLAGLSGAVLGVVFGAGLSWPLLLLGRSLVTLPVFVFVCLSLALLGYRVGVARRDGVIALLSSRAHVQSPAPQVASLPRLLDTSVAIDGRIVDVVRAGFVHGRLLVPTPVLAELQGLADAADEVRRAKGRRGLDVLDALRRERGLDVEVIGDEAVEVPEVDAKLIRMALDRQVALLTLDTNLAKVAALAGVRVMNLHALALALRPPVVAGDTAHVLLTRAGKEAGQAVGYLDDGTMVVVERARELIGSDVTVAVTSVLTSAGGRMVFARLAEPATTPSEPAPTPRPTTAPRPTASETAATSAPGGPSAPARPHPHPAPPRGSRRA